MKLTHNQLALLTASLVLGGLLVFLSILYFQAKKPTEPVSSNTPAEKPVQPVKPKKLTKEERDARKMERQAEVVGTTPEEAAEAVKEPEALIERTVEREEKRSQEEKMSDLIHQRRQLEQMKTEDAEEALGAVTEMLNLPPEQAEKPRQEVSPDQFDADSAQIDSCERIPKTEEEGGDWRYVATLVDANGNTMKVELSEPEGESTWRTMQMLKENPLMDAIYRNAVMPLLDRGAKEKPQENTD